MRSSIPLDAAEIWLSKQVLGSGVIIHRNNAEYIRMELKRRIFEEVRQLLSIAKLKPPFDPREIAKLRKVLDVVEDLGLIVGEACLIPTNGGFIIKLNPRIAEVKKRFNCAHEIGHTYFYDLSLNPPKKLYPKARYWVEEGYACEIAGEILAPEPYLSNLVLSDNSYPSLQTLIELREYFNASFDVLARRLLHSAHSVNKEFWGEKAWQGIIIVSLIRGGGTGERLETNVYRSPEYRKRLADITSKKLEEPYKYEGKIKDIEIFEKIRKLIFEGAKKLKGVSDSKTVKSGGIEYCIEVGKVGEKTTVSVIYENR